MPSLTRSPVDEQVGPVVPAGRGVGVIAGLCSVGAGGWVMSVATGVGAALGDDGLTSRLVLVPQAVNATAATKTTVSFPKRPVPTQHPHRGRCAQPITLCARPRP
jgi:hypothetical protein